MNTYPNLQELVKYHPYGENTACDHAEIEPELLHAAFKGEELLTPAEIISIARLYGCPAGVIVCPKLIMLDMGRPRHKKMVMEVDCIYIQLKCMARDGNRESEKYLELAGRGQQRFMRAAYEDRLSYAHYLGVKKQLRQYISFAAPKQKRRRLGVMKGGAV